MSDNISNGDNLLVKKLIKGNYIAFNALYEKYSYAVFRFAMGYVKSANEAEEIVQEVFMTIWARRDKIDANLSFKSFIFTIAFHSILKFFRSKSNLARYVDNIIRESPNKLEFQEVNCDFLCQYVKKLTEHLPPRCREVFIKSRFEDLSISEIAQEMEISHKTVENQLTVALKYIRKRVVSEL